MSVPAERGEGGAVPAVTGAPVAALNGVLNVAARPDAAGIAELAALTARELTTVLWSIPRYAASRPSSSWRSPSTTG